ncbi:MAG: hypothetical protein KC996_08095, partial [Phycisphaerales bacterium]|nr:hypothetical protein [Phycisphaerales bacterium]
MDGIPISLIGGGGHAKVVLDAIAASGRVAHGVYDDHASPAACADGRVRWLGEIPAGYDDESRLVIAVGAIDARERIVGGVDPVRACGAIVHPSAVVSPSARVSVGTLVGAGAVVHADAAVGLHGIINTGAIVEHDCVLGVNVHVAPGAVLGGGVVVGDHSLIGIGACV